MAGGILEVAAEEAEGAPLPTPRKETAEATTAVPTSPALLQQATNAPTRPFTKPERAVRARGQQRLPHHFGPRQ